MTDGIYNIKDRLTLHILVAYYTNKHVIFNKGQCMGHTKPSIDHMPQTAINSVTTQKMLDEHIQPDTFTTALHTLLGDVRKSLNQLLETFKSQLHRMKPVLEPVISLKCKLTGVTQNLSHRGHTSLL